MTIILETDQSLIDEISTSVMGEIVVCGTLKEVYEQLEISDTNLLIVGPSLPINQVAELSSSLRVRRPLLGVVLLRSYISESDLRAALESGCRSVVSAGDAPALQGAISRSVRLSNNLSQSLGMSEGKAFGKVMVVFSTKGGVGKTTFSVNLAKAVADEGLSVCLVDLDVGFGNLGISLNVEPKGNLDILLGAQDRIDQSTVDALVSHMEPNLDAILSPSNPILAEEVSVPTLVELVKKISTHYDLVLIDTGDRFSDANIEMLLLADEIYLMGTPDVSSIQNLKIALEAIGRLNVPDVKQKIVLNRYDYRGAVSVREVKGLLGFEEVITIPENNRVMEAMNKGWMMITYRPRSSFSKRIRSIAKQIATRLNSGNIQPKTDDKRHARRD